MGCDMSNILRVWLLIALAAGGVFAGADRAAAVPAPNGAGASKSGVDAAQARSIELNERGAKALLAKDFKQAEEYFRQALAADAGNVTAAFNLAGAYLTNKKEGQAISLLEPYARSNPQDAGIQVRLGDAYFTGKRVQDALRSYEAARSIEPAYSELSGKLATVYTLSNRMIDAEKLFLEAVEVEPKNAKLLASLSSVFLANGKADNAISTAKRALQVKPSAEVYITLGAAYEAKKDFKNSLISYQRARDLGYSQSDLEDKIDELEKIRS